MPLPKPKKNEKKNRFISRCLSDSEIKRKFGKGTKQAKAVCFEAWRNK